MPTARAKGTRPHEWPRAPKPPGLQGGFREATLDGLPGCVCGCAVDAWLWTRQPCGARGQAQSLTQGLGLQLCDPSQDRTTRDVLTGTVLTEPCGAQDTVEGTQGEPGGSIHSGVAPWTQSLHRQGPHGLGLQRRTCFPALPGKEAHVVWSRPQGQLVSSGRRAVEEPCSPHARATWHPHGLRARGRETGSPEGKHAKEGCPRPGGVLCHTDSLEVRERRLLWPGQDRRPVCSLGHGQLQQRRPGGHRRHTGSRPGHLPWGTLFYHLQELGLVGWHRRGLGGGRPPGGQVEGLELVTVPGGSRGCAGGVDPVCGDPGLQAGAAVLGEARGFPEAGPGGQDVGWGVAHPPGDSGHPGTGLHPPQGRRLPPGVLGGRAGVREAALRGRGWQQGAWTLGGEGVGTGHLREDWLPGRGHRGRRVGRRVDQGICRAKRATW